MLPPDVPAILSYGPALPPFASGSISPFSASIRKGAAAQATDKKAERMNDRICLMGTACPFAFFLRILIMFQSALRAIQRTYYTKTSAVCR